MNCECCFIGFVCCDCCCCGFDGLIGESGVFLCLGGVVGDGG